MVDESADGSIIERLGIDPELYRDAQLLGDPLVAVILREMGFDSGVLDVYEEVGRQLGRMPADVEQISALRGRVACEGAT